MIYHVKNESIIMIGDVQILECLRAILVRISLLLRYLDDFA
jgi:hypothetical protein